MDARRQELTVSTGLLILRLGIGGYLLTHGLGKLRMLFAGNFEQMGDPIGLGPVPSLILVTMAEFLGALLVMLGLGTRLAAAFRCRWPRSSPMAAIPGRWNRDTSCS